MYLLALIIILLAVALLCVWTCYGWQTAKRGDAHGGGVPRPAPEDVPSNPSARPRARGRRWEYAGGVDTVVYYQDNFGYLVPVLTSVPYEDGIAKATLSLMVASGRQRHAGRPAGAAHGDCRKT